MKYLIVISADYHGDCMIGATFDKDKLTVTHLIENIIGIDEIADEAQSVVNSLIPNPSVHERYDISVVVVDSEFLSNYMKEKIKLLRRKIVPATGLPSENPRDSIYKISSYIRKGMIDVGKFVDLVEVALSAEDNSDRIERHLARALAYAVDECFPSVKETVFDWAAIAGTR